MGFLASGVPLEWTESLKVIEYIRVHGVEQFLRIYGRVRGRTNDVLLWGDEIECHVVQLDAASRTAKLCLRAPEVLASLSAAEAEDKDLNVHWAPEYGAWMIEGTPARPYGNTAQDLIAVEGNMAERRRMIQSLLGPDEHPLTIVAFPLMGVGDFTAPSTSIAETPFSNSCYVPDAVISAHPRFGTLTRNIRTRRGSKVDIRLPIFRDEHTVIVEDSKAESGDGPSDDTDGFVHMDCMAFGMGCCCLQVTFQARDLDESRRLYDQLSVVSPIVMALTAASPIFKGKLVDSDTRWKVISMSTDCRTPAERGDPRSTAPWQSLENANHTAGNGGFVRLQKPRYDSIDLFISTSPMMKPAYNDINVVYDASTFKHLVEGGVDELLARHIAHLFARDPMVIYGDHVELDDDSHSDHFENVQSTNWQNVRWKPPPPDKPAMGWRVELRTMEVQLTDFENAAFAVFSVLLGRVILFFDLSLYIPISKVDENLHRASLRNAAVNQKFYFRKNLVPLAEVCGTGPAETDDDVSTEYVEMTTEEIMMGKGEEFPGLLPLISAYLDVIDTDAVTKAAVDRYLRFIAMRARGEVLTAATWMRNFVMEHPEYRHDSIISPGIAYDLLQKCVAVSEGRDPATDLLGHFGRTQAAASPRQTTRMRGSSFSEEVSKQRDKCLVIGQLVAKYTVNASGTTASASAFRDAPAYFAGLSLADPVDESSKAPES